MSRRLVITGPRRSGKTTLANALSGIGELREVQHYYPTIGVRIIGFEPNDEECITVYDTSGDPSYRHIISSFCAGPVSLIFVFPAEAKDTLSPAEIQPYALKGNVPAHKCLLLFTTRADDVSKATQSPLIPEVATKSFLCRLDDPTALRSLVCTWINQIDAWFRKSYNFNVSCFHVEKIIRNGNEYHGGIHNRTLDT